MSMSAQGDTYHIRVPKHPQKVLTQVILEHSLNPALVNDHVASEITNGIVGAICSGLPSGILRGLAVQIAGLVVQKMDNPEEKDRYIEHMIRTLEKIKGSTQPEAIPEILRNIDNVKDPIDPDSIEAWRQVFNYGGDASGSSSDSG